MIRYVKRLPFTRIFSHIAIYFYNLTLKVKLEAISYQEKLIFRKEALLIISAKCEKYIINPGGYLKLYVYIPLVKKLRYLVLLREYLKYRYLLFIKESRPNLYKLIQFIENLYDKNVELNIVNLKKMHLNSDIFAQAVSLKLRNRENKLYRVLKASLRKIKV